MRTYERVFSQCNRQIIGPCEHMKYKHIYHANLTLLEISCMFINEALDIIERKGK